MNFQKPFFNKKIIFLTITLFVLLCTQMPLFALARDDFSLVSRHPLTELSDYRGVLSKELPSDGWFNGNWQSLQNQCTGSMNGTISFFRSD
ncbi:MAG: hypothetical protein QCI00_06015, partial [Candidatus Thermoplasmatota archaeon]|nr:hypothetical protein [Candidatus Thermoplasmatota archaeon]